MGDWNVNPRKVVEKHPDCVAVGECRPRHQGGKNTRLWCRGRAGIPHTWEWLRSRWGLQCEQRRGQYSNRITDERVCFGCSKIGHETRSYCRQCGERWPWERSLARRINGQWVEPSCAHCGAPNWMAMASRKPRVPAGQ